MRFVFPHLRLKRVFQHVFDVILGCVPAAQSWTMTSVAALIYVLCLDTRTPTQGTLLASALASIYICFKYAHLVVFSPKVQTDFLSRNILKMSQCLCLQQVSAWRPKASTLVLYCWPYSALLGLLLIYVFAPLHNLRG